MSAHRLPTSYTRRLWRRLSALPLVAALACADGPDPVAPPPARTLAPDSARPAAYAGAASTEFSGVQVQSEGMGLSVKFNYTGVVTPAFTIFAVDGESPKQVRSVAAKKQAAGYWTAHAGGLTAGRFYQYRLESLASAYEGTAKTLRRNINFDLDSAYAHNDGDPGPPCGEILLRPYIGHHGSESRPNDSWFTNFFLQTRTMCSGNMYRFTESQGGVLGTIKNFENTKLSMYIRIYELDKGAYCLNWTPDCGQRSGTDDNPYADTEYDVYQSGSQKFVQSTWWGFTPHLTFYGKLLVSYVPW